MESVDVMHELLSEYIAHRQQIAEREDARLLQSMMGFSLRSKGYKNLAKLRAEVLQERANLRSFKMAVDSAHAEAVKRAAQV